MAGDVPVVVAAEAAGRHGVVEDEAGAAHQMPGIGVVDAAVIAKVLKEAPALPVDATRVVEAHDGLDVTLQEVGIAKVGIAAGHRWSPCVQTYAISVAQASWRLAQIIAVCSQDRVT